MFKNHLSQQCEGDRETLVRDCIHLLTNFPIGAMSGVLAKLDNTFIPDAESREVTHLQTVVNVPKVIFDYLMDAVQVVSQFILLCYT